MSSRFPKPRTHGVGCKHRACTCGADAANREQAEEERAWRNRAETEQMIWRFARRAVAILVLIFFQGILIAKAFFK